MNIIDLYNNIIENSKVPIPQDFKIQTSLLTDLQRRELPPPAAEYRSGGTLTKQFSSSFPFDINKHTAKSPCERALSCFFTRLLQIVRKPAYAGGMTGISAGMKFRSTAQTSQSPSRMYQNTRLRGISFQCLPNTSPTCSV